ncbi:MAG: hypothetical protein WD009_10935 [Phycisphaeraceae bacterium]
MADVLEKHARRIHDLIAAQRGATVLAFVTLMLPLLSPVLVIACLLYGAESRWLLRRYPELEPQQAAALRSAKTRFLVVGCVHVGLWVLLLAALVVALRGGS